MLSDVRVTEPKSGYIKIYDIILETASFKKGFVLAYAKLLIPPFLIYIVWWL